jgi:hypothetical protein
MKSSPDGKKKPGPKPKGGRGTAVLVRCDKELLAQIDSWRSRLKPFVTRAAALRWFAKNHFVMLDD